MPLGVQSDGAKEAFSIGVDAGYTAGMYLMYNYTSAVLGVNGLSSQLANTPIWQVTLNGMRFNDQTCNYATGATIATCPPNNCQLATCNARNIQANYGSDYCTGQSPVGPTAANTIGCGISVLAAGWPYMGPPPPAANPIMNTGNAFCPDNSKPAGLAATQVVAVTATVAISGYTAAAFGCTQAAQFSSTVAQLIIVQAGSFNVNASQVIITADTPAPAVAVGSGTWLAVTYSLAIQSQYTVAARTYMSTGFVGQAFANSLRASGLTLVGDVALLGAPTFYMAVPTSAFPAVCQAPPHPPPPPSPPPPYPKGKLHPPSPWPPRPPPPMPKPPRPPSPPPPPSPSPSAPSPWPPAPPPPRHAPSPPPPKKKQQG